MVSVTVASCLRCRHVIFRAAIFCSTCGQKLVWEKTPKKHFRAETRAEALHRLITSERAKALLGRRS